MRFGVSVSLIAILVSACGGGGGGVAIPPGGGSPGGGGGGGGPGTGTGAITAVNGTASNGAFVPTSVAVNGVTNPVLLVALGEEVYSDGPNAYRITSAPDGQSYSVVGFTFAGGSVGTFNSAATPAPTSGTANYAGTYRGQLFGPFSGAFDIVTGDATAAVEFNTGIISGTISNRNLMVPSNGYDVAQLEADVFYLGTVTGGNFTAGHTDVDSRGAVNGAIYADGLVGTLAIDHIGAFTTTNQAIPEFGGFAGAKQ